MCDQAGSPLTYCDRCQDGTVRIISSGLCVAECPPGTYQQGTDCYQCGVANCNDCIYLSKIRGERCEICLAGYIRNPDQTVCFTEADCDLMDGHRVSGRLPAPPLTRIYDPITYMACDACRIPNCKALANIQN